MRYLAIVTACVFAAFALMACSTKPQRIDAAYVSPLKYKNYTCDDIEKEVGYLEERTLLVYEKLKNEHQQDNVTATVGILIFWPVLFALDGDGPGAYEFSQLKGEFVALQENSLDKDCGIEVLLPGVVAEETRKAEEAKAKRKRGERAVDQARECKSGVCQTITR